MLDIKIIRENPERIKTATIAKGFDGSVVDELIVLDEKRRKAMYEVEELRAARNKLTKDDIEEGKKLKTKLKDLEDGFKLMDTKFDDLMVKIPNPAASDVKVGTPEENEVIKTVGKIPIFNFPIRDHVDIGLLTDTLDLERGAKVAQSGFYYLKGDWALLEMALVNYAFAKAVQHGFTPVITPNVVKERNIVGCGFQARSDKERQIYHVEGEDLDLIATAEIPLIGMHTDEVLDSSKLPLLYAGYSSCYRQEIGSYGKDVRGTLRTHEFRKVEMVVFCLPEESDTWHEKLLAFEEEIWQELKIPYQVIKMSSGDLGNAASRKYDIEAWMPSQNKYREVTSTSNTTDFQARRLNIKTRIGDKNEYVHTLNGTILAMSRTPIAILENYQNADGSVTIPEVLRSYMGKDKIERKK
ncbi:MAG: serine--tRNA ligase [Candidatus Amesbacteria bacterium]|nr:serine--tRNA ligase [Candidatus Amesbacteria bacterium]